MPVLVGVVVEKSKSRAEMIVDFENLVDELLKEDPNENRVKALMEKLNLSYNRIDKRRVEKVLEKMNSLVFEQKVKKDDHDLR